MGIFSELHFPNQRRIENRSEHLSPEGPRGGSGAAVVATPRKRDLLTQPFVRELHSRSHKLSGQQDGIPDRIGCVTQNSSGPITH